MNLTSGMLNGHVPCKPVAPKLFTGCFLLSAELARPLREFPAQSSHECRDCLAELDVTTANGQVGCATQLPGMQSKEASCTGCNISITFPFTQCLSVQVTIL